MLRVRSTLGALLAVAVALPVGAASEKKPRNPAAVERLKGEAANVAINDATGGVRFAKAGKGKALGLVRATSEKEKSDKAMAFLERHGQAFGLRDARAELKLETHAADRIGGSHLTYSQHHFGVPVFGASLKAHYDGQGNLSVVNGTVVPDIDVNIAATRSAEEAGAAALKQVSGDGVTVRASRLLIFREGLAKGVPGDSHLAYEVEVGNGGDVREFVYVDAHTGKAIDRISGIQDALHRRAYDAHGAAAPGIDYPHNPFWEEGDPPPPTAEPEADNMILASGETYNMFSNAFGRDSFDGLGGIMDSIFNRGNACPNASWNGIFISFCPGLTTDDVTGHEWGHAYTQYTHNLIYQWQPGALNESYSDIWGETIDRINGRGGDTPNTPRQADASCSVFGGTPPPTLTITGGSAAGSYLSRASVNEPPRPFTVGPTAMAIVATAAPFQTTGACGAVSGVSGKIAIVDWTLTPSGGNECGSATRANNARLAGATGIIFVAPASGLLNLGASTLIASVQVMNADGATIKAGLPADATITLGVGTDSSVRWLMGEDDTAAGLSGPLRDMWNPRCFGNPGKVSDTFEYVCSTADAGGVHSNSGIPNHAYALLVDGGTYNGQTVNQIGLLKAAHIYFRAADAYQVLTSGFSDHADAIEQSCSDLTGVALTDFTGGPSGQSITPSDCAQVEAAAAAVELRTPPSFCNFRPLLAQTPPPLCSAGAVSQVFKDNFENGDSWMDRWSVSHSGITADFTPRDWEVVGDLPDDRPGRALFGSDPDIGTCAPGGDETALLTVISKQISIPSAATDLRLTFDHWLATEPGWDGGNLKISVNGGAWQLVQPHDYAYNPYNLALFTTAQGNTNPIAGQPAFSGTDGGQVDGTWGRSIVNLAPYAPPGSKVKLRFDIGNDGCTGRFGWYVDNVLVYRCK